MGSGPLNQSGPETIQFGYHGPPLTPNAHVFSLYSGISVPALVFERDLDFRPIRLHLSILELHIQR